MARAGAFSANFDPVVLDDFRSFCSGRGEKYTKVLEQLAIAYLNTEGELLAAQSVPAAPAATRPSRTTAASSAPDQDLVRRLSRLEENDEFNAETFETIFKRLEEAEKVLKLGKYKK